MPSHPSPLDHRLDRLFDLLGTATLRRRAHFIAQQGGPGTAAMPAAAGTAAMAAAAVQAAATVRAGAPQADPVERLFDLLATATLRGRERFIAQQQR